MTIPHLDQLIHIIDPESYSLLARGEALPQALQLRACEQARHELHAIAGYIPSRIVIQQIKNPQPGKVSAAYWNGTILLADLSGFTTMSAQLSSLGKQGAEEISTIINNLFEGLVSEVYRFSGILLKFGGDALTAFFAESTLGADHATMAACAALAMQERMAAYFAAIQTRAGSFNLQLRIGVHSGRVFAAEIGDQSHIELMVTGKHVNRVAQAQEFARPGDVIITEETIPLLNRPVVQLRSSGFWVLERMAWRVPSRHLQSEFWPPANGDIQELAELALRIAALRPYLPYSLPHRFLESTQNIVEQGEFRPVSILFAHIASFSKLLELLGDDTERAVQAINAYYARAQAVIHRYDGIVNKIDMYSHGDKLMALFGAPIAHEDAPLNAVRAAFELRDVLQLANQEIADLLGDSTNALQVSTGINTGVVFAGQVGSAQRHEYTVMGQTVNIAARLMSVAKPDTIVLPTSTKRAVIGQISLREMPPAQLKGVPEPVPIFEALKLSESDVAGRVRRISLIGRTNEMQQMLDCATQALQGQGRIISLSGEPGVGKSRLVGELIERLLLVSKQAFFLILAESQSYETRVPFAVIRELLQQVIGIVGEAQYSTQRIHRRVAELAPEMLRFAPLLGDVLGLPLGETELTQALSLEQRHERTQELIEEILLGMARTQPLVIAIDDLHWCDASSLELLGRISQHVSRAALLMVLAYRRDPPIDKPWERQETTLQLSLPELNTTESAALAQLLLEQEPPMALKQDLERAQGNPLFIEALIQDLIEREILVRRDQGWEVTRQLSTIDLPNSIEGVITARLDRLDDPLRETIQVASVIGRRFAYGLLNDVLQQPSALAKHLEQLDRDALVKADTTEHMPALEYSFVHPLTRDVAYEAILYARRRDLHRRVAQSLEDSHNLGKDEYAVLLANHYLLAENWPKALEYHIDAGRQAQQRFANREAIAILEQGLSIIERMSVAAAQEAPKPTVALYSVATAQEAPKPTAALDVETLYIEFAERLGVIHALIGEYDTALSRYHQALEHLQHQADSSIEEYLRLYHHIASVYEKRATFERAFDWLQRALDLAGTLQSTQVANCWLLGAGLHQRQGRYPQALEWGQHALDMAIAIGSSISEAAALLLLGGTYRNIGDNQRAFELMSRSLERYQETAQLGRQADAYNNLANICYELGRLSEARRYYEAGAKIKQDIGDVYGEALIAGNLGEVFRLEGHIDQAIAQYGHALAIYKQLGSTYGTAVLHMNLGAAHLLRSDLISAEAHLKASATLFAQAAAEDFLPELERYQAELALQSGNIQEARSLCEQALLTAARLDARAEAGITRRLLAQICIAEQNLSAAWEELDRSLLMLREAESRHEIARTQLAIAELAGRLARPQLAGPALQEAIPILEELGASRDLEQARQIERGI